MALMDAYRVKRAALGPEDALVIHRNAGQVYDPSIMAYRPRRSHLPPTHSDSADSADYFAAPRSESRRSSVSSYASFSSSHSTTSTSQTSATSLASRRSSFIVQNGIQQRSRSTQTPSPLFRYLPPEVYECILQQLKVIHSSRYLQSCSTCYLRDFYNLALTSRSWNHAVRIRLYDVIPIVGFDSAVQLKKFRLKSGVRLKLLRRTLRQFPALAEYVHELQVPDLELATGGYSSENIDLVASVIMACPNFERLTGFHVTYHHTFNRLVHALSTRSKLKAHIWIIGDNKEITDRSHYRLPPGLMDTAQASSFIQAHDSWSTLTTLILHSQPDAVLEHDIFISIFERLPSLLHLAISSFDIDDFNDDTLQYLPPLLSLRLESLAGLSDSGLSHFASSFAAQTLQRLSLLSLEITSLFVLSKLLAHLSVLTGFTFAQSFAPTLAATDVIVQPLLASSSLSYLHWDIAQPPLPQHDHLALSLAADGFPALATLRAPNDPHGALQALCRPRAQIVLPSDKYKFASRSTASSKNQMPATFPTFPSHNFSSLHAARAGAQARLEAARQTVGLQVVVDEEGHVTQIYDFPGYLGRVRTSVEYDLRPNVSGTDWAVCGLEDVLYGVNGRGNEKWMTRKKDGEMCTGLWNASNPAGKKWWGHGERERWKGVELDKYF